MGVVLAFLYVALTYISIGETFPVLAPFRIMIGLGVIGLLVSILTFLMDTSTARLPQFPLMIGFIGALCFSRLIHGWIGGVPATIVEFMPVAAAFFLVAINISSVRQMRLLVGMIGLLALMMIYLGLQQYYGGGGELVMVQRMVDPATDEVVSLNRLMYRGFLGDPNDFAQFLLTCVPFFGLYWKKRNPIWNFLFVLIPWSILAVGIMHTRSRGALVGVATLVLLYLKEKIGMAVGAVGSILLLGTLLVLGVAGGRALSIAGGKDRLDIWSDGIGMIKGSPLWGVGYGGFTDYAHMTAHNSYLLAAAETGFLGLFFWMGMIVCSVMQLRWLRKMIAERPALAEWDRPVKVVQFSLWAFLVTAYFLSRTYTVTLYILIALTMVVTRQVSMVLQTEMQRTPNALAIAPIGNWMKKNAYCMFGVIISVYVAIRLRVF